MKQFPTATPSQRSRPLDEALEPVRREFEESGMTEEELVQFLMGSAIEVRQELSRCYSLESSRQPRTSGIGSKRHAEHIPRSDFQPALQERRVDTAEVNLMPRIAVVEMS